MRHKTLKAEKEELLKNFDKVFVRLFPNFVSQLNTLFKEEDQIILKENELPKTLQITQFQTGIYFLKINNEVFKVLKNH